MVIPAAATSSARLSETDRARLADFGLVVGPAPAAEESDPAFEFAIALELAGTGDVWAAVADRGADRHLIAERLEAASVALARSTTGAPLTMVVLPATLAPQPGPIAVISPAGAVSSYELYVGAALAAAGRRRVEHLNGRGTLGSAPHSGVAGRLLARGAAPGWREQPHARPERSLHTLGSRPSAIVVAVPPGSTDAAALIADHPDADVVLVFDRAHAQHGAAVAQQAAAMIELAFSLGSVPNEPGAVVEDTAAQVAEPAPAPVDPAADLPGIRASDVIHVRLTSDALELTNRTAQRLRLRVALASVAEPDAVRAVFAADLAPGEVRSEPTAQVEGLVGLAPPAAVMRHWSHESEEVFEGGEQRVVEFRVAVLDDAGAVRAEHPYRPGNGLDYFVTARDLAALIGRPVARSVLPEPAVPAVSGAAPRDLLGALASALAVGAAVLEARRG